ncbi:MAG: hypothetical protein AMJ69_03360 [Gammaproteobacteria bacterium SG8_47]|nr:MAG: hypothetical protein AMJ69_03360 [Gammaproteobacteria bacterium SG8_47]
MKAKVISFLFYLLVLVVLGVLVACEEGGLTGVEGVTVDRPFAYIVRNFPDMGDTSSVDSRPVLDPRSPYDFNPGARLYVRDRIALTSDEVDVLSRYFGGGDYDVKDLTVSPDGTRIAFAAHGPEGSAQHSTWNIYEYDFSTRKVRRFIGDDELANAGQDTSPAYSNDGRIVFSSDRQVATGDYRIVDAREYIGDFDEPASLLHIMQPDGSEMVQITFGAYHDVEANSMNDGQIVFIRWGREYETLYDCTEQNIDDPNFNTHPHGGGYGHGNGNGFPSGLDEPKTWTIDDKCGGSVAGDTNETRLFIQDVLSLYRVAPSGANMHRYFGSKNEAASDASFIHYMDPIPLRDGNLITIMRHIYNPIYGGDVVKINSENFYAVGKPIDDMVTGVAEESMTPGLVNFYPDQVSPTGWYSAVFPYRDGSGRLLAGWAQCLVREGEVSAVCEGSSTTTDLHAPQYGIWVIDPSDNTRLPVVKGHNDALYTDIVVGNYNDNARPYVSPQAEFLLDDGFGAFHIRSVYDLDGVDMAEPDGGITTMRDPSVTAPDDRSERFIRVLTRRDIPSELAQAILDHPELNPTDGSGPIMGLRPILGSGPRGLYDILSYGMVEPDGSAIVQVPHDTQFTFEVVNKYGKRVNLIAEPGYNYNYLTQHPTTLLLEEGELRECGGCHDPDNDIPHARSDIPTAWANPGAPGDGTPFPNANPQILAARYGDTMAEALTLWLGYVPGGTGDVDYEDYWTNPFGATSLQPSFAYRYRDLTTPAPVNDPACVETWTAECKITINYLEHIQPIWNVCRPQADNRSCTSCHDKADNTPADKCPGGGGPGGDLVLGGDPDPWNPQEVASYVQLFESDYYQKNESGEWVLVTDPDTQCPNGIEGDLSVEPQEGICITRRLMSARGAIASARFFRLFDNDPDDDAYEVESIEPNTGNKKDLSFHRGMLTPAELRVIAEWLDTGAHYFNDTEKYDLPPQ